MGRWLSLAREQEKKSKTEVCSGDKTDETPSARVLSVSSLPKMAVFENSGLAPEGDDEGVSSVLSLPENIVSGNYEGQQRPDWWNRSLPDWRRGKLELHNIVRDETTTIYLRRATPRGSA